MNRKDFTLTLKIVDEFGRIIFKMNSVPVERGVRELTKFVNGKLR